MNLYSDMERVITGYWNGVPISRPKTAAEQLAAEIQKGEPEEEDGYIEIDVDKVHEIIINKF